MGLEVGERAFHGPSEEPDDLDTVVGLSADGGPEVLDAEVFEVVVRAVGGFGEFCCLLCTHVLNGRGH